MFNPNSLSTEMDSYKLLTPAVSTVRPSHPGNENTILLPRRPVPEFLFQLTQMLSDQANHQFIEWSGRRVVVHDAVNLENEVLQKYFRHSKYSSFQRQMNYFGFRKNAGKGRMSPCTYENDTVLSDDLSSLLFIRRKTQGAAASLKKVVKAMKPKQENAGAPSSVSDDESNETPKMPLSQVPDICISHQAPKVEAMNNVPLVVTAKEYGAPGTMKFPPATPGFTPAFASTPSILAPKPLVEQLPLVPPVPMTCSSSNVPMPTADTNKGASPLSQPPLVSSSPEPITKAMFAHHQHNVPNPLLASSSHQPLPCPSSLPATSAAETALSNSSQVGEDIDLSSQFMPDLTLGFLDTTTPSVISDNSRSPDETLKSFLTSTLPSSNTLFELPCQGSSLVSLDGSRSHEQEKSEKSLSPSSSLVDLAMLPIYALS